MPWHVAKSDSCPPSKPWACVADMTGEVMGCHASQADAQAQVDALYANEPMAMMSGAAVTMPRASIDATAARAHALRGQTAPAPCGNARSQPFRAEFRAKTVIRDGKELVELEGYASVVETPYDMWDVYGPYQEVISARAFDKTLAARPDVSFLVNHRGVTMARTTNGTLQLSADSKGLLTRAFVNPARGDVRDLVLAIGDENVTEMSFAFAIPDGAGQWSEDFARFRINETNLDRGDVSAVNYGANPYTSVGARAAEILSDLEHLPAGAARAAIARLNLRTDLQIPAPPPPAEANQNRPPATPPASGRSLRFAESVFIH